MKAIAYCRASTTRQEKSIPEQRAGIQRYADGHGITIVEWFVDDGVSGSIFEQRPGFQAMLAACRRLSGDVATVLLWDKSRFGRPGDDARESGIYEREIHQTGKSITYVASNRES